MRTLIVLSVLLLAGCNALGGIQPEAITAIRDAGGGCIHVKSLVMGEATVTVARDTKGGIRNGGVIVTPDCGINITDTHTVPVPAGASTVTTTTVTPAKPQ